MDEKRKPLIEQFTFNHAEENIEKAIGTKEETLNKVLDDINATLSEQNAFSEKVEKLVGEFTKEELVIGLLTATMR